MSEVSPQISVVTLARTKIIVARAIFDEILMECGLISSTAFRWSSEPLAILLCARPFPPRVGLGPAPRDYLIAVYASPY